MSTTLAQLVADVHSALHSYTGVQEQLTYLTAACTDSDTTLSVAGSENVMRGIAEIDDELIYVEASDSGTITLPPFGRGFRGSTAAAHSENAMVTFDPAFPKVAITRAINQCIEGLYPLLYQVKSEDLSSSSALTVGYALPADCDGVLAVYGQYPSDPQDYWTPVTRWSFDSDSPDGNILNLYGVYAPGTDFRVVYKAKFSDLVTDFATSGLSESYADLIIYCVTARLIRFLDPARLQLGNVENISRSQVVQAGDAGRTANQLYAMYQQRLVEERRRLLELHPPVQHFLPR